MIEDEGKGERAKKQTVLVAWFIQILAMVSDVVFFVVSAVVLYWGWRYPLCWILIGIGFMAWLRSGAFIAWTPSGIRAFYGNMKGGQA